MKLYYKNYLYNIFFPNKINILNEKDINNN